MVKDQLRLAGEGSEYCHASQAVAREDNRADGPGRGDHLGKVGSEAFDGGESAARGGVSVGALVVPHNAVSTGGQLASLYAPGVGGHEEAVAEDRGHGGTGVTVRVDGEVSTIVGHDGRALRLGHRATPVCDGRIGRSALPHRESRHVPPRRSGQDSQRTSAA